MSVPYKTSQVKSSIGDSIFSKNVFEVGAHNSVKTQNAKEINVDDLRIIDQS